MDNEQVDAGVQVDAPVEQQPVQTQSDTTAAPAEATKPQAEKVFTQAQMQAVAAKEARKAEERAEARIRSEYESRQTQSQQAPNTQQLGGMPQVQAEEIQRLIRQEAYNMSRDHQAKQIEQDWVSSMDAEKMADPEFAELYDAIGIEQQPYVILAMAGMENKAKVVKDLAKNPSKYANILTLANGGSPKLAQIELNKLSASIKTNEEAKKQPKVDAPLSQIRASNIGGDDGAKSVTDYRAEPWLRG